MKSLRKVCNCKLNFSSRIGSWCVMFLLIIIFNFMSGLLAVSESAQDKSVYKDEKGIKIIGRNQIPHYLFKNDRNTENLTYMENEENILRVPKNFYENQTHNKKPQKKSQKRTIQKIIKKGRSKTRRIYVNAATRAPTQQTERYERIKEKLYTESAEELTTQRNRKRKFRKTKLARNPMPFHSLQSKNNHRNKRDVDRDLYILQDLDEIEFLSGENDYNIVKAHVKPIW